MNVAFFLKLLLVIIGGGGTTSILLETYLGEYKTHYIDWNINLGFIATLVSTYRLISADQYLRLLPWTQLCGIKIIKKGQASLPNSFKPKKHNILSTWCITSYLMFEFATLRIFPYKLMFSHPFFKAFILNVTSYQKIDQESLLI